MRAAPHTARGGGVAEHRHPRAGTGSGSYGYYGHPHHGGGYYGGYHPYHGGYYGHYGYYGYYPYYRPYVSLAFGFGWPYYGSPYYSTGYYGPSYYVAPPSYAYDEAPPAVAYDRDADRAGEAGRDAGRLRLEVRPEDASVYVDDTFRGTAREARSLSLGAGRHTIELVRPGYATERHEVEIVAGERRDLLVELQKP